jgi:hypothetical protein
MAPAARALALRALTARAISYITLTDDITDTALYDAVLDLPGDGSWQWRLTRPG